MQAQISHLPLLTIIFLFAYTSIEHPRINDQRLRDGILHYTWFTWIARAKYSGVALW